MKLLVWCYPGSKPIMISNLKKMVQFFFIIVIFDNDIWSDFLAIKQFSSVLISDIFKYNKASTWPFDKTQYHILIGYLYRMLSTTMIRFGERLSMYLHSTYMVPIWPTEKATQIFKVLCLVRLLAFNNFLKIASTTISHP